jgi:predicted MPP superfamily phosphohydrolase
MILRLVAKSPSSLVDAASWVEKRIARLRRSEDPASPNADGDGGRGAGSGRAGIKLRRFAGPRAYREQLSHLRIAHLTDLHVGRITPLAVQRAAVEMANAERPDLVVLTGDFVCHSQLFLDQLIEVARSYRAPTFAVLGNHDHWSGADEVAAALKRAGVEVLRNQNTTIEVAHQRLQIVGLDDAYTGHARPDEACKGLRHDLPVLGLSHIAEEADGLWRRGIPLVLSGHTHGGQVTVARLHELALGKIGGHKYLHGLYGSRGHHARDGGAVRKGEGAVYVGAGIGAAVMPLRLGDRGRREVTIFELGAEPGSFEEHHAEQKAMPGRKPSQDLIARRKAKVVRKRLSRERRGL